MHAGMHAGLRYEQNRSWMQLLVSMFTPQLDIDSSGQHAILSMT
jgi:hypothetical protein